MISTRLDGFPLPFFDVFLQIIAVMCGSDMPLHLGKTFGFGGGGKERFFFSCTP